MGGWGASLTAALIPLPAGSDPTAAARGNYMAPGRKPAEGRLGLGGSEYAGGDTDGRDHAAESGVSRSPGESCASTCSCTLSHAHARFCMRGRRGLGGTKPAAVRGLSLRGVQC